MNSFVVGGKNKAVFLRLKLKADKSDWDLLDKLTTTVVTGAGSEANAALTIIGDIESSKPQIQDTGLVNTEIVQYEAEDLFDFLDVTAVPAVSTNLPDVLLEDGVKKTSGSSDELVVMLSYLFPDKQSDPTKLFIYAVPGEIDKSSGSFETKGDGYIQPTLKHNGKAVPVVDLKIKKEWFDANIVTVAADIVIPKTKGYWRGYQPLKVA